MSKMKNTFQLEAAELLKLLETLILQLEREPNNKELVSEVFRGMHTFKAISGMAGLNAITEFVHHLETIYDLVRDDQSNLSKELIDITLESIDLLKILLEDLEVKIDSNLNQKSQLTKKIIYVRAKIEDKDPDVIMENEALARIKSGNKDLGNENIQNATFHIFFSPGKDVMIDGSNPLYLIDELSEIGNTAVFPRIEKVRSLNSYNYEKCLTSWDIIISGNINKEKIEETFIFIQSESILEINKIAEYDLLVNPRFREKLNAFNSIVGQRTSFEDFAELADPFINEEKPPREIVKKSPSKKNEGVEVNTEKKQSIKSSAKTKKKDSDTSIRVTTEKLDKLMEVVSEIVTAQASLESVAGLIGSHELDKVSETMDKLSRRLKDVAFSMTLVPIKNMFNSFQRMVRDISKELGKNVHFVTEGGETELDKTLIENLRDPLVHILRNSLDHGLETPEERLLANKPEKGTIKMSAYYQGAYVCIKIEDDGEGLNTEKITEKAIERGIISSETVLSKKEIHELIFTPGFSTAAELTDVSGRGVGMDVVKKNISQLRGIIAIDSEKGIGTTITIKIPLTLSIIDGLLVTVLGEYYVIPLLIIDKCHEVLYSELLNSFHEIFVLDGRQVPYINLRSQFSSLNGNDESPPEYLQVVTVNAEDKLIGLCVDTIIGQYQAVLKPLGETYKNQDFISGASILGDGTVALVLDIHKTIGISNEGELNHT